MVVVALAPLHPVTVLRENVLDTNMQSQECMLSGCRERTYNV